MRRADSKQKKPARNGSCEPESESIAYGVITDEVFLPPFEGEAALLSMREALFLAGHELQSQIPDEFRI
jgi:hypothetical protein